MRSAVSTLLLASLCVVGCRDEAASNSSGQRPALLPQMMQQSSNADATPPAVPFDSATPRVVARAVTSWPHDTAAYTQGLMFEHGRLLESTGLEGRSDLRELERGTARVLHRVPLPSDVFGEGLAGVGDSVYQLTWKKGRAYVYDARTLALRDSVSYQGEGWGLASDERYLYFSDGTSEIRVIDPTGFKEVRRIRVTESGQPVWMLNELEVVRGELWANIYETSWIARIDLQSGHVVGWIDVGSLLNAAEREAVGKRGGVPNGIAYDSAKGVVMVTGKLWPRMFELEVRR